AIAAVTLSLLGTIASAETARESYDKVLVDDVELSYDVASPLKSLSPAEAKRISAAARAALESAAKDRFTIVAEPGPNVIRLHASISASDAAKKGKHFWTFTPVGLIKTRVDVASGADIVVRAATVEISVLDAQSGEPLRESIDRTTGEEDAGPSSAASLRELAATLEAQARRALARVDAP